MKKIRSITVNKTWALKKFLCALAFLVGLVAFAQTPGTFTVTGSLHDARVAHTATLLPDGRVLVVGGGQGPDLIDGFNAVSGAELFDPATSTFTPAGTSLRDYHTATLLQSGQVLVAGGESGWVNGLPITTPSAELYNPTTASFQQTGSMVIAREIHTATLLKDGRVLIVGGTRPNGLDWESLPFAEIYDPATGTFSLTGSLNEARWGHTATLLTDGRVLITGGSGNGSAEIYDPVTGSFTYTGSMNFPRSNHTATLLVNGQVLISGTSSGTSAVSQVYDPTTGLFQSVGSMTTPRIMHSATRLADGTVLIAGGYWRGSSISSAEIYDPTSGLFTRTADMNFGRLMHTATLLSDGSVLVVGGAGIGFALDLNFVNPAEVYRTGNPPASDPWQQAITAMKTAAGIDSANFWQWAWYWQRSPAFSGAPAGFGVLGSIDNTPGLIDKIVAAGGGNGFQTVSAVQWVLDYRQAVQPPDPWQQAITAMKASAGTDSINFWQWAWYWQRSPAFSGAPAGFGVLGSIDNIPGMIDKIVAAGGGNGSQIVSAEQWVPDYRQAAAQ